MDTLRGAIGGVFGLIALTATSEVPGLVWTAMWAGTIALIICCVVTFLIDNQLNKTSTSTVQKLRLKMDAIVSESDRKDAI